jgi:hypothetical protein
LYLLWTLPVTETSENGQRPFPQFFFSGVLKYRNYPVNRVSYPEYKCCSWQVDGCRGEMANHRIQVRVLIFIAAMNIQNRIF